MRAAQSDVLRVRETNQRFIELHKLPWPGLEERRHVHLHKPIRLRKPFDGDAGAAQKCLTKTSAAQEIDVLFDVDDIAPPATQGRRDLRSEKSNSRRFDD